MNKTAALQSHSKRRAKERLGMNLTNRDLDSIVGMIRNNRGQFVEKQSNRVTLWKVHYRDNDMQVLYDKTRQCIITVFDDSVEVVKHAQVPERKVTCPFCDATDDYSTQKKYKTCETCGNMFI